MQLDSGRRRCTQKRSIRSAVDVKKEAADLVFPKYIWQLLVGVDGTGGQEDRDGLTVKAIRVPRQCRIGEGHPDGSSLSSVRDQRATHYPSKRRVHFCRTLKRVETLKNSYNRAGGAQLSSLKHAFWMGASSVQKPSRPTLSVLSSIAHALLACEIKSRNPCSGAATPGHKAEDSSRTRKKPSPESRQDRWEHILCRSRQETQRYQKSGRRLRTASLPGPLSCAPPSASRRKANAPS